MGRCGGGTVGPAALGEPVGLGGVGCPTLLTMLSKSDMSTEHEVRRKDEGER